MSEHHHKHHKHNKKTPAGQAGSVSANEGEGSRSAAREYNKDLQSFIEHGRVAPAADKAKQFVDQHPEDAATAEHAAAAGPRPIRRTVEELVSEGRAMWNRTVSRVRARLHRRHSS